MKKSSPIFYAVMSLFLMVSTVLIGCSARGEEEKDSTNVIRIGYQKNGPLLILKSLGTLEERLEEIGFTVEWNEFQAGPALLEALNAGSIDLGRTGNSPPVFAQAADAPLVYVAAGKSKFKGSGILVPEDSPINSLEDLKGKRIGFAKGSSSHFLLVKALESVGISYDEITPAYLQPGDARVAFEQGNIDAWVVWDPYTASAQINSKARMITDGEGFTTDRDFFLATKDFASKHKEVLDIVMQEVQKSSEWANQNHDKLIPMLADVLKIDEASIQMTVERRVYGVDKLSPEIMQEQQEIADTFYDLEIIPKKINVEDALISE
ncbi:MAG TPA: sulfonate ABC transporter substrate-binding protein [Bacillus sp. (in: firmicutes)]|uniref:sulfonate ABC transporter substrate-binding protein n=1 Tax=Bacillus litorisediminis TaxID=2922713 RepID=UPI001FABA469|nr:sulfonate ABC transporter substrate-binding protein [Bacillus litorisediminis]HWO75701.1 sulfonate ABC transporter substrate-binding protein [Bacillus sp. (in: firmicutes)]